MALLYFSCNPDVIVGGECIIYLCCHLDQELLDLISYTSCTVVHCVVMSQVFCLMKVEDRLGGISFLLLYTALNILVGTFLCTWFFQK